MCQLQMWQMGGLSKTIRQVSPLQTDEILQQGKLCWGVGPLVRGLTICRNVSETPGVCIDIGARLRLPDHDYDTNVDFHNEHLHSDAAFTIALLNLNRIKYLDGLLLNDIDVGSRRTTYCTEQIRTGSYCLYLAADLLGAAAK